MSEPQVTISLDGGSRVYKPGDTLAGHYMVEHIHLTDIKAIELSVLWYTEGKGDEELAVHHFERFLPFADNLVDLRYPRQFSTPLPNSPMSYDGVIVNIRWCVRVRVFLKRGKELLAEQAFQLGSVPPAQAATT
jgi:hypothetical protein